MTISLLIPVYNFDIVTLVHSMKNAFGQVPELLEIIIGDDGSTPEFKEKYRSLEDDHVRVLYYEKNIGRAAIRNRLASEARGDAFLFIDSDVMLPSSAEAYINRWIPFISRDAVVCGGILYRDTPPGDPDKLLRWKFGKSKEQMPAEERNKEPHTCFSTFNLLIGRDVLSRIRFNEDLKQYGQEDTLMGYQLRKAGISVLHIDNGLYHEGIETNTEFIHKTKQGIENLSKLYDVVTDKRTFSKTDRMLRIYNKLKFFGLTRLSAALFIRYRERIEMRLISGRFSLRTFRIYRFCMFCTFREIHIRKNLYKALK